MGCKDKETFVRKPDCVQYPVPTVDNTELECDYFISSKCIFIKDVDLQVDDKPYPTLNDYIQQLELENSMLKRSNSNLKKEVEVLSNKFNKFVSRFDILERRVSNIRVRNV